MAKISTVKTHSSGIALGGIGSGSVELLPDGEFHFWQIANPERFTTVCGDKKADDGESSTGALSFYIRTEKENRTIIRKLGMKTDPDDFTYRMFGWNKPVERIDFDGKFPVCQLDYIDSALPCNLTLNAVAPFVPHNSDIAATPGFYLDFTVENITDAKIKASLLGTLEPNFANKDCETISSVSEDENSTSVFIEPKEETNSPSCGNLCFSVNGDGEKTFITADFRKYIKEYIAWSENFGVCQESVLFDFKEKGRLLNTTAGTKPAEIPENIDDETAESLFNEYKQYPSVISLLNRICHVSPDFPKNTEDKKEFLQYMKMQVERMGGEFGSAALCQSIELEPGEKKNIRFILTWYFPNHLTKENKKLGHYYENLFASSKDANTFLLKNSNEIFDKAVEFSELLYNTDMPYYYPDCWSGHLSTIVKSSWYLKDGKFGLWEGLGYCGFHTTDITYHASFGLLALFPDLQKKQMKMGAAFQREDGRVHHFFTPDLEHVDDGFDRVDMNMQFVLMVLRDYLFTGDREYLESLWKNVKDAMDSIESLDRDYDGLPDYDTKRNTYDAWNFSGTPTYICVLWLSALKAAAIIAEKLQDKEREEKWLSLLEKGNFSLEEKLFNGEYYNLWCNENQTDESLMTDQLDGEWFLRMTGLEGNIPDERVKKVLEVIFEKNFNEESGLINASCAQNKTTSLFTYKNCQAEAVWTGIGYVFAALCLNVGLRDTADKEVLSIHDNQMRFGYFWDHWECGHHYTRPMSSWATLNASLGLYVNAEEKTIRLKPISQNITLPLCTCDVLATVTFRDGKCTIDCKKGSFDGWNVIISE